MYMYSLQQVGIDKVEGLHNHVILLHRRRTRCISAIYTHVYYRQFVFCRGINAGDMYSASMYNGIWVECKWCIGSM